MAYYNSNPVQFVSPSNLAFSLLPTLLNDLTEDHRSSLFGITYPRIWSGVLVRKTIACTKILTLDSSTSDLLSVETVSSTDFRIARN